MPKTLLLNTKPKDENKPVLGLKPTVLRRNSIKLAEKLGVNG